MGIISIRIRVASLVPVRCPVAVHVQVVLPVQVAQGGGINQEIVAIVARATVGLVRTVLGVLIVTVGMI